MSQAVKCKNCGKLDLKWKTLDGNWWVHCDSCGNVGPAKETQAQAGEAWNEANRSK